MSVDVLVSRLENVRKTGPGQWRARCPAHDGTNPTSLSIGEGDDGRALVHCFARQCSVESITGAVGLTPADLMPERLPNPQGYKPIKRPFLPADAFDTFRHINQKMLIIVGDTIRNEGCPVEQHAALTVCQQQLDAIAELCYGQR